MCISKPMKVMDFSRGNASVEFMGERKSMKSIIKLKKGDYVLCQSGIVVQKISAVEAKDMLNTWKEMNLWKKR